MTKYIAVICILLSMQVKAETNSSEEFSQWMMYYYQKPTPSTLSPMIKKAYELKLLEDPMKVGPPLFGFIAGVLKSNPNLAQTLTQELSSIEEPQYGIILVGIWYANLPNNESRRILSRELEKHPKLKEKYSFLSNQPVDLLTLSPRQGPWVLDTMWGYFFATGSNEPVLKIISVLPWIDESKKEEVMAMGKPGMYLMATSGAARWSLTSNAKQHKRIFEICQDQIQKQPDIVSKQLREIVNKATRP